MGGGLGPDTLTCARTLAGGQLVNCGALQLLPTAESSKGCREPGGIEPSLGQAFTSREGNSDCSILQVGSSTPCAPPESRPGFAVQPSPGTSGPSARCAVSGPFSLERHCCLRPPFHMHSAVTSPATQPRSAWPTFLSSTSDQSSGGSALPLWHGSPSLFKPVSVSSLPMGPSGFWSLNFVCLPVPGAELCC